MAEQQSRELAPAISTTRAGNASLPVHGKFPEVRFRPLLRLKSLQPRTQSVFTTSLQAEQNRPSDRMARPLFGIRDSFTIPAETGSHSSDSTATQTSKFFLCWFIPNSRAFSKRLVAGVLSETVLVRSVTTVTSVCLSWAFRSVRFS